MSSHKPMSMEAVMDEERREVLALLQGRAEHNRRSSSIASAARSVSPYTKNPRSPMRSISGYLADDGIESPRGAGSPAGSRPSSPRPTAPTVRSMLDIDSPPPAPAPVRSMLDVDSPPLASVQPVFSAQNSPTEPNHRVSPPSASHRHSNSGGSLHPRSMSDAAGRPVDFGPRALQGRSERTDPTSGYQFSDIITNRESPIMAKRTAALAAGGGASGTGKRAPVPSSMVSALRGADIANLKLPGHTLPLRGRNSVSGAPPPVHKSKSPHNRLGVRSKSPHVALNTRALSPAGAAFLAESQGLDMQNAYRRLSDAAFMRSRGSLSELPMRNRSDDHGTHGGRLTKDYMSPDGEELPVDSSDDDDDDHSSSSDDEDEGLRGRKADRGFSFDKSPKTSVSPVAARKDGHQPLSLLAAAEEERIHVASTQPYRSLLEPEIVVTNSSGEKVKSSKSGVHPANSFDQPSRSGSRAPWDSEDEAEYTDIKRAQKLSVMMTPIMSTPETARSIRIIYRGEFAKVQKEAADDEHRRVRKYLVATDLSDESTHALEWAIGTVLRDGDTLVAIYCVDEEAGIPGGDAPEDPKTMREQARAVSATSVAGKLPESLITNPLSALATATAAASTAALSVASTPMASRPSLTMRASGGSGGSSSGGGGGGGGGGDAAGPGTGTSSSPAPPLVREKSRAEEDRSRAVQDITDRITRLLRKTRLQVRVIVEVLHCKTPRHLITEVIDLVNPTLVILGSRGRSALKGVILGSFSNYLVTKSSVPVMVARKRLRKQSKFRRAPVHQVNNLSNPATRSLANAKID